MLLVLGRRPLLLRLFLLAYLVMLDCGRQQLAQHLSVPVKHVYQERGRQPCLPAPCQLVSVAFQAHGLRRLKLLHRKLVTPVILEPGPHS